MAGTEQIRCLDQIARTFGAKVAWEKLLNHIDQKKYGQSYYETLCTALSQTVYNDLSLDTDLSHVCYPIEAASPIWIMWWQGERSFPPLIQKCVDSIRRHAGNHPVILITQDNLKEFVQVHPVLLKKFHEGVISVTAFSDIVRFALLEKYGGLWLDATIFLRAPISELIDGHDFFSIRKENSYKPKLAIWSGDWTVYCMGGGQGLPVFGYVSKALTEYWNANDFLVDYFLTDCTIRILFDSSKSVRRYFRRVPAIAYDVYDLEKNLSSAAVKEHRFDGSIYKLNRKEPHLMETSAGQETVYAHLIQGRL